MLFRKSICRSQTDFEETIIIDSEDDNTDSEENDGVNLEKKSNSEYILNI